MMLLVSEYHPSGVESSKKRVTLAWNYRRTETSSSAFKRRLAVSQTVISVRVLNELGSGILKQKLDRCGNSDAAMSVGEFSQVKKTIDCGKVAIQKKIPISNY